MQVNSSQIVATLAMQSLLQELIAEFSSVLAKSGAGGDLIERTRATLAFAKEANAADEVSEGGAA